MKIKLTIGDLEKRTEMFGYSFRLPIVFLALLIEFRIGLQRACLSARKEDSCMLIFSQTLFFYHTELLFIIMRIVLKSYWKGSISHITCPIHTRKEINKTLRNQKYLFMYLHIKWTQSLAETLALSVRFARLWKRNFLSLKGFESRNLSRYRKDFEDASLSQIRKFQATKVLIQNVRTKTSKTSRE